MVQVLEKEEKNKENNVLEESLTLEELPMKLEKVKELEIPPQEESVKK